MVLHVTFDTNAIDKVVRPERFPKDPSQSDYIKINTALKEKDVFGYFCETIITLEGIQKIDRAEVFSGTHLRSEYKEEVTDENGHITITLMLNVEQPQRKELHRETIARIEAATDLGFEVLKAPRIGIFNNDYPENIICRSDKDEISQKKRQDLYHKVLREIESRGVGISIAKSLGDKFSKRSSVKQPWFKSLNLTNNIHEEREVERAIAEWADADAIAAHVGYGIELFCTSDAANKSKANSVFNTENRQWLQEAYNVNFVTVLELANRI